MRKSWLCRVVLVVVSCIGLLGLLGAQNQEITGGVGRGESLMCTIGGRQACAFISMFSRVIKSHINALHLENIFCNCHIRTDFLFCPAE